MTVQQSPAHRTPAVGDRLTTRSGRLNLNRMSLFPRWYSASHMDDVARGRFTLFIVVATFATSALAHAAAGGSVPTGVGLAAAGIFALVLAGFAYYFAPQHLPGRVAILGLGQVFGHLAYQLGSSALLAAPSGRAPPRSAAPPCAEHQLAHLALSASLPHPGMPSGMLVAHGVAIILAGALVRVLAVGHHLMTKWFDALEQRFQATSPTLNYRFRATFGTRVLASIIDWLHPPLRGPPAFF